MFQMIHTLHNLADMLDKYEGIPPTLRDDKLRDEAMIFEQKYMQKCDSQVSSSLILFHLLKVRTIFVL